MASVTPENTSTRETSNYAKLCRLLVDIGSCVVREIFDRVCPAGNLHTVLTNPKNHAKLQTLRKKRVLGTSQWRKLYPAFKSSVSSRDFDTSLLVLLLRNIWDLTLPASGQDDIPLVTDTTSAADITCIKILRDRVYSHVTSASVDDPTFSSYWNDIQDTFQRIAGVHYKDAINELKIHCMDADLEKEYQELLKEWLKDEDWITGKSHEDEVVKKARKEDDLGDSIEISEQSSGKEGTVLMPGENESAQNSKASPPKLSVTLPLMSDLPGTSSVWSNVKLPVDILLLTVENCEFLSCFAYLKEPFKSYHKSIGPVYFGHMGDDQGKKMNIALMKCKRSEGPGGPFSASKDAILVLRPKATLSVGACRGLDSRKVKLGDVVVSAKLITAEHKTPPSRDIGNLIKHVADGWKAPLQNADKYNAKVHCDGVVLSISDGNMDIISQHPEAIAVEMEGGDVFAAAHDFNAEWVVIKGIGDFVDETQSCGEKWKQTACVMAASVVANILNDPIIFQDWPHFNADLFHLGTSESHKPGLPEKPTIINAESEVDKDFTVTWSEAEANSSNCNIKYRLEWRKQPITESTEVVQRGNIVETHYKITGLEYGTEYEVKLFAVNRQGDSKADVRTFKTKSGLPEKPTITNVESEVDKDFTVTWSEVEANSSNCSIKYRLEWTKQPMTQSTEPFQRRNIVETHYEITGLEYDTEYEMKLFAVNKQGDSEPDIRTFKTESDAFDPTEMIENISQLYKTREGTMNLLPWCDDLNFSFGDIYTRLKIIYKEKTRGTATDRVVIMSEIFNSHEECEEPRVVLIEGKPGMGKTTFSKKVVFDWATQKLTNGKNFAKFLIVLLIKCREVQSDLWEAIDDQLLPRDIGDDQRKRFLDFIRHNQSKVLLVLDGLDEVSEKKLPMFSEIIQGRALPKCRVVVTARHEAGVKVRKYCDTLLEVEGFTEEDVETFIKRYFRGNTNLAEQLIERLHDDETLHEMSTNPLNIALLCLVYEDLNGVFPESRSKLYMDIVDCILRRYRAKKQLSEVGEDLVALYENQLNHLGSIALKGLLEDNLDFDEKELGKHKASDLPELGFLSVQPGGSKQRATRHYGFLHKTFQEFFAALNLVCQLIKKEISTDSIAVDRRYRHELKEVLLFTFGLLGARCKETAENLMKSMATQLNQEDGYREAADSMNVILECIYECKNENDFDVKLACALGPCLQIETITVSPPLKLEGAKSILLTNILRTNTSMTELNLSFTEIGDDGAAALADCLKEKTSMTDLNLSCNKIGDAGAAALAECMKENASLTDLNLSSNEIACTGAAALAKCLIENTSLTDLNLCSNEIGGDGAAALAEYLKENTSLTDLNLSSNEIGDAGAAAVAECLKEKTSLTDLDLSSNEIAYTGAAALAKCLKENTSLTNLDLSSNEIGDDGAAPLAECLKENASLTYLNLSSAEIGDDGTASLAECLKENTCLTHLNLSSNKIGDDGAAALAECVKEHESLRILDLNENNIGEAGAAFLADCLKENTSLTDLDLISNEIGDNGATALAECLKENTSLTVSY